MPTYAMDESFFEEYNIPINGDEFTRGHRGELISKFSGETVFFKAEELDGQAQLVLRALRESGVTSVYCRYDGGGDEGFAHFETAYAGEGARSLSETIALLSSLGEIKPEKEMAGDAVIFMSGYYSREHFEALTLEQRVKEALDYLAYALGCQLLGEIYGTGVEGAMYGAFRANLQSGEIVDEFAEAPEGLLESFGEGDVPEDN